MPRSPAARRLLPALALALAACATRAQSAPAALAVKPEYEVKAVFIDRIVRFVEWPAGGSGEFSICVVGRDPFGPHLRQAAAGAKLDDRPFVVRAPADDAIDRCQVLFIAADRGGDLPALLARVEGRPVLTIADSPGFGRRGVMINFFIEDGRVRFEANPAAFQRARLHAGARLLQLARLVGPPPAETVSAASAPSGGE